MAPPAAAAAEAAPVTRTFSISRTFNWKMRVEDSCWTESLATLLPVSSFLASVRPENWANGLAFIQHFLSTSWVAGSQMQLARKPCCPWIIPANTQDTTGRAVMRW